MNGATGEQQDTSGRAHAKPVRASGNAPQAAGAIRRPVGRPVGTACTRETILEAARCEFAAQGFDHATIRGIAALAGVDPALVMHYFDSKVELFGQAITLPVRPAEILRRSAAAGPAEAGASLVRSFLAGWGDEENRQRLVALLRSALTNDVAMACLRDYLDRKVLGPVTQELARPDSELRATLVGSQLIGLAIMRYVVCIEPLASASDDELAAAIGPSVQRYLTGDFADLSDERANHPRL
jgi:AcrR family transcriptional regulator